MRTCRTTLLSIALVAALAAPADSATPETAQPAKGARGPKAGKPVKGAKDAKEAPAPASAKPAARPPAGSKGKAAEARARGQAAADKGEDEQAVAAFLEATRLDPTDELAQHELGKILFKQGKVPEAIERFQAAVKLDGKDALAWYNLAFASRRGHSYAQAAESYRRYIALVPDDPDAHYGLAESLRQAGLGEEAIAAYESYVKKESRPGEQKWVERSKERIAELRKAVDEAKAALAVADEEARKRAAEEARQKLEAQQREAAAAAEAEARSPPPDAPGPQATGQSAGQPTAPPSGRKRVGLVSAPVAPSPSPTLAPPPTPTPASSARLDEGARAFAARDFRTALFAFLDVSKADPRSAEAFAKAGECYLRLGFQKEAEEQWRQALAVDPAQALALEGLGRLRGDETAPAGAPAAAAAPGPAEPASATAAGGTRQSGAEPPAASPAPRSTQPQPQLPAAQPPAATAAPVDEEVRRHYLAADEHLRAQRYEAALAELDEVLRLHPGHPNALIARGTARIGLGDFRRAAEEYAAANAADPSLASPLFGLAECARGLRQNGRAVEYYRQYINSMGADATEQYRQYARQLVQSLAPQ